MIIKKILPALVLSLLCVPFVFGALTNTSLSHYWEFNEVNTGVTPNNISAGNNGAVSGASLTTGFLGQGLSFDGTNDNVTFGGITLNRPFSISMWIKPDAFNTRSLMGDGSGQNYIRFDNASKFSMKFSNDDAGSNMEKINNGVFKTGWQLITFVANTGTAQVSTYLNTTNVDWEGSNTMSNTFNPSVIASRGGIEYFDGLIDEVAIWNKALDSSDISELYNLGAGLSLSQINNQTPSFTPNSDPLDLCAGGSCFIVDGNNSLCDNSWTRTQLLTQPNETVLCDFTNLDSKLENGDTVYIRGSVSYYNGTVQFDNKQYSSQVSILGYPGEEVNLTNFDPKFLDSTGDWNNVSTGGMNLWYATIGSGYTFTDDFAGMWFCDGTPIFHHENYGDLVDTSDGAYWLGPGFFSNDASQNITARFKDMSVNPNNECFYVSGMHTQVFEITGSSFSNGVRNLKIANLSFPYSSIPIRIRRSGEIIIENIKTYGGVRNAIYLDLDNENITVRNNILNYTMPSHWPWNNIKGTRSEGQCIENNQNRKNIFIHNNTCDGWFNGYFHSTGDSTENYNTLIYNNRFIGNRDDAIEIESYCNTSFFYNNLAYGGFVGISMAPTIGQGCHVYNNKFITSDILATNTSAQPDRMWGGKVVKNDDTSGMRGINYYHNTGFGGGITAGSNNPAHARFNITNNIFNYYQISLVTNYELLGDSGQFTNNIDYAYNLWYKNQGTNFADDYNGGTASYASLLAAVASGDYPAASGWHRGNITRPPLFDNSVNYPESNYTPSMLSPFIDAGAVFGFSVRNLDSLGNKIYGLPDMGAIEYQPPFNMGTDSINTTGNIRVYDDGKFRYTTTPGATNKSVNIQPNGGFNTSTGHTFDLNITSYTSTNINLFLDAQSYTSTYSFNFSGMLADTVYDIETNETSITSAASNSLGFLTFTYNPGSSKQNIIISQSSATSTFYQLIDDFEDNSLDNSLMVCIAENADGNNFCDENNGILQGRSDHKLGVDGIKGLETKAFLNASIPQNDIRNHSHYISYLNLFSEKQGTGAVGSCVVVRDEPCTDTGNDNVCYATSNAVTIVGDCDSGNQNNTFLDLIIGYNLLSDNITVTYQNLGGDQINSTFDASGLDDSGTWTPIIIAHARDSSSMTDSARWYLEDYSYAIYADVLNIKAKEVNTNNFFDDFQVSFNNGSSFLSSSETLTLINWTPGNYTVTINATGFITNSTSFEYLGGQKLVVTSLYPANEIFFNFLDENTREPVQNVTYELISTSYADIRNTTSGQGSFEGLPSGDYEIKYNSGGYNQRSYFFSVPLVNNQESNFTMYLINTSDATSFILTVTDQQNVPIDNSIVSLLRYYVIGNDLVYEVVEMMRPNFNGETPFSAYPNTVDYVFRVTRNKEVIFQGASTDIDDFSSTKLIDTEQFIRVNLLSSPFAASTEIDGFSYEPIIFINSTNTFRFSFEDSNSTVSQVCLDVELNGVSNFANTCLSSGSGIILVNVTNITGYKYVARAIVTSSTNAETFVVDTMDITINQSSGRIVFGILGLFILMLTLIFVGTGMSEDPVKMISVGAFAVIAYSASFLGLVSISIVMQGTIFIVACLLLWMVKR